MADGSTIGLVATSSVLAAALTQGMVLVREWWTHGRSAAFSALYLALALESYARECSTLISDSETYENSDGHAGTPRGRLSPLPEYADGIDWHALGLSDTTAALSFRVSIENENAKVAATFEFGDDDDGVSEVREAAATLGLQAITLAGELRRRHRIDPLALDPQWNVERHLVEKGEAFTADRTARNEANRQMWIEIERGQELPIADGAGVP